jgi:hypothetical protein
MCYAICLSQLGLFCSTISRNSQRAVGLTFVIWLFLEFGGWLLKLLAFGCKEWGFPAIEYLLDYCGDQWWESSMWSASSAYLNFVRGDHVWHSQMVFHLCVGLAFFLLSWILFEPMNQASLAEGASASEHITRGLVAKTNRLRSLRCWDAALTWKSWQFQVGGWLWVTIGILAIPALSLGVLVLFSAIIGDFPEAESYSITLMVVGVVSFLIVVARLFGRVLNREIYQQTLVSLCMLPRKRWVVISELYLGLLPGIAGPICCFTLGFFWLAFLQPEFVTSVAESVIEPWFWMALGWLAMTIHIGALLSVYMRHGGMLIAIALCYLAVPFLGGILMGVLGLMLSGLGNDVAELLMRYMLPMAIIVVEVTVCVLTHGLILRRIEVLASK